MREIILWPVNKEFDIRIEYRNECNWPRVVVSKDDEVIMSVSLMQHSIKEVIEMLLSRFPESEFLNKLVNLTTV